MSAERGNQLPTVHGQWVGYSYIRTGSRSPADQEASIARQQTACRLLAATCRLPLDLEFIDRGTGDRRPAFDRLVQAIAQRRGGVYVLVASADRLAHSPADRRRLIKSISAVGGQVVELESVRFSRMKEAA